MFKKGYRIKEIRMANGDIYFYPEETLGLNQSFEVQWGGMTNTKFTRLSEAKGYIESKRVVSAQIHEIE